jgi:hypothetical protein
MKIDAVYFHAYPYTSEEARQKVINLAGIVGRYSLGIRLTTVGFTEVQMRIRERAPLEWSTVLLRMAMMDCAELLAGFRHHNCLISGERLSQVASQTIENNILINGKNVVRPDELQYYISKNIVLERRESRPMLEINATGDLIQWEIATEERLSLIEGTSGELRYTEWDDENKVTLSICFDYDDRLVLNFRQDAAQGNRFYLVYDEESNGSKKLNYGKAKQYLLSFSGVPVTAGDSSDPADPRPYLQIKVSSMSETVRINRNIDGRNIGN